MKKSSLGKRKTERFDLELPASVSVAKSGDAQDLVQLLTRDICSQGAFLNTRAPLPEGTQVNLRLMVPLDHIPELKGRQSQIQASGTVVRSHDNGMAIQFDLGYQLLPIRPHFFIHVTGKNKLLNELLTRHVTAELGMRADHGPMEKLAKRAEEENSTTYLALVDYLDIRAGLPLSELEEAIGVKGAQCVVALFNAQRDQVIADSALRHGARGIFFADDSLDHVARGLEAISKGELWYAREVLTRGLQREIDPESSPAIPDPLTRKEKEILGAVAAGSTNKEIAEQLFISVHTVKTHLYNVYRKINASNRLQATLWATKNLQL
ncbi:DNA-binding response regulator, NarL/FixJ family, contains REC and HTH domains [Paucidesulfovibrio gracilis DSM 16080]|uniref:DNA-binding response regulator, NarL/FixJ family, contains REC and HTH domains n=1 Tax=Paucidesulfovibrio gracilis DSM 16080 TaxID=1121449 RepID=A0A1T4W174_9BACT|nr:LuxR C-terminal-related transcriptional regulator [Paucidesulfovibrio gracilis]SKA71000.1 DNA-binding response regulator, NarL/FixJ family, contains REC and HTH domains [Paucidesulfovibrio gracilis DSM 16080]